MANIIDTFLIQIGIDASQVTKGGSQATKELNKVEQAAQGTGKGLRQAEKPKMNNLRTIGQNAQVAQRGFKQLAGAVASAAAAFGALRFVQNSIRDFVSQVNSLTLLSNATGESMENIQAWGAAVYKSGGEAAEFESTLSSLADQIQKARFGGANPFAGLGVNIFDADGVRETTDILFDVARQFETLDERFARGLGRNLGLDRGTIELLLQGEGAVRGLVNQQRQLNVYTRQDTQSAREFRNVLFDLRRSFQQVGAQVARIALPGLQKFATALGNIVAWARNNERFLKNFFYALGAAITFGVIPAMTALAIATNSAFWPLLVAILAAVAAAALFALVLDDIQGYMNGEDSMFGRWIKDLTSIQGILKTFFPFLRPVFDGFEKAIADIDAGSEGLTDWQRTLLAINEVFERVNAAIRAGLAFLNGDFDQARRESMIAMGIDPDDPADQERARLTPFARTLQSGNYFLSNLSRSGEDDERGFIQRLRESATGAAEYATRREQEAIALQYKRSNPDEEDPGFFGSLRRGITSMKNYNPYPYLADAINAGQYVNQGQNDIRSGAAMTSRTVTSNTRIGEVRIYTEATDANGISGALRGAIVEQFAIDGGVE